MKHLYLMIAMLLAAQFAGAQRVERELDEGWQFSRDGKQWEQVRVPHDWAISGPFDKKWDLQKVAIKENGEQKATEKSGRSGALPWIGEGIYKTELSVPEGFEWAELMFDGAMSEPVVYVNGSEAGRWAYGYNAFRINLTPFLRNRQKLQVEVRLKNLNESSRWYPGGGLYRPVRLVMGGMTHADPWGVCVRTTEADSTKAVVCVDTQVKGADSNKIVAAETDIIDHKGHTVGSAHSDVEDDGTAHHSITIHHPKLWSPETPYLYKVRTRVYVNNKKVDEQTTKMGIRTISCSREHGFQLNGVSRKFKGVCLHHDLGPLGAAVNRAAIERQVRLLKDMGCDAIRTAHNMPSTMQMEVCDSMGMMVMAESFDGWKQAKVKNGYNRFWDEWHLKDVENLILNHRNHPSIVMWSMGNEIPEQWKPEGAREARELVELCHKLDPTRPVTVGMDKADGAISGGLASEVDVPGFNYRVHLYDPLFPKLRQGMLLGSETASTVSSRGVYKFPVVEHKSKAYSDGQCSSYDTECCSWSNLPDDDWKMQDDREWTIGEFVWTGFDYLGEPSPYDEYWPSRSSYFGIFDLAGLPKDRYWLYRSHWRKDAHTIHLLPHWNWKGREGEVTPVYCYTDWPTAELFLNGKSQGKISKQKDSHLDRYRLRWNNVKYEPGELKVVVYDEHGNKQGEQTVRTAGKPHHLILEPDRKQISANGNDLSFITVKMADKDGTLCPTASHQLKFTVSGAGEFKAACNGDATSLEPFTQPTMQLFNGELVVVVEAKGEGKIRVEAATADGKIKEHTDITAKR